MAKKVEYIRNLRGNVNPVIHEFLVNDSQTIVSGDLLCISAGKVSKASSSVHTLVVGIAMEDITTTTATDSDIIQVMLIDSCSVLRMACTGSDPAQSAVFTTAYDINDDQAVNFADTTGGFLLPVTLADDVKDGYIDVIVKAASLWNN